VLVVGATIAAVVFWPRSDGGGSSHTGARSELTSLFAHASPIPENEVSPQLQMALRTLSAGGTTLDASEIVLVLDHTSPPEFQTYVVPTTTGGVCVVETFGSNGCYSSFTTESVPSGLTASYWGLPGSQRVVIAGVVPDGVRRIDVDVRGHVRPVQIRGSGAFLMLDRGVRFPDIRGVTYRYADGTTSSGPFLPAT
jgi:hypothetical protein